MVGGEAPSDLWDVDIRRFAPFTGNRKALAERTRRDAGPALCDALAAAGTADRPAAALQPAVRPARRAQGAEFGSKNGWERANYFKPDAATPRPAYGLGRPGWLDWVIEEQRATRENVAVYDQSSFGKLLLQGRDALAVLQRLCANQIDMPVDRMVYTALLNERGGFESDLTVIRLAAEAS